MKLTDFRTNKKVNIPTESLYNSEIESYKDYRIIGFYNNKNHNFNKYSIYIKETVNEIFNLVYEKNKNVQLENITPKNKNYFHKIYKIS